MRQATLSSAAIPAVQCCLLCGGLRHRTIFNEFEVDILQCIDCHHVFSSFVADPHFDGFWGDEVGNADPFYWSKGRARMHGDFVKSFIAGHSGRLLDMGCGLGYFIKALAPYPNWEVSGCEISAAAVRYGRETLGLRNVVCSRLEDAEFPRSFFDMITMWDVLEHIPHPDPLLRHCHGLLREGGLCFIRTPNVVAQLMRARLRKLAFGMRPELAYLMARDHMHHYSAVSIRHLLERNGFAVVKFMHLHPIQSKADNAVTYAAKNMCFETLKALAMLSGGSLNLDNLFVLARKHVLKEDQSH